MASNFMTTISHLLESSIDRCINELYDTSVELNPDSTPEKSLTSAPLDGKSSKHRCEVRSLIINYAPSPV